MDFIGTYPISNRENMMKRYAGNLSPLVLLPATLLFFSLGCPGEDPIEEEDAGVVDVGEDVVEEEDADSGEPTGPYIIEDPYVLVPHQSGVDRENGHPDIEAGIPGEDESRVGRIMGEETGFSGVWSHCRSGDFRLTNSVIDVCIQNETTNRYETYTGGKLVDARRHSQPPGDDVLDMVMTLIDIGTATADEVEVVRDGSDGGVAVLRVTGEDIELAHLAGVLGSRVGTRRSIRVTTEYRLEPGSEAIEMLTIMEPNREYSGLHIGDWFAFGDRARGWTPGKGFGVANQTMPWVAGIGEGHTYGMVYEDGASPIGLAALQGIPWAEMRADAATFDADNPAIMRRWFVVGDGGMDSVRKAAARVLDQEFPGRAVSFEVVNESGDAVADAEVVIRQGDEWITVDYTDESGAVEFWLEEGSYEALISEFAGPLNVEESFEVGVEGDVELTIPDVAQIEIQIQEEGSGQSITSRVRFMHSEVGTWSEYAVGGNLTTFVPAGEVQVVVTRGLEYDLFSTTLNLDAGGSHLEEVELVRGVDTSGWRSGDFHQHMEPSIDSRVHVRDRVLENASQGVELMVATDHEVITDLQPAIDDLGLGHELSTFPGIEFSPLYAHYNVFPVPYRPNLRGRGSVPLADRIDKEVTLRRMPEIIETARAVFATDPVVQMNHPRNNSGMFNHVQFDPELGPDMVTHEDFVIDIDAIEVINRYGHVCQVLADWSGLLNAGYRVAGLGNSDTHHTNGEAGVPRNYMRTDRDPGDIDADVAREAIRSGQITVGGHAFVDFGDDMIPGDEITVDADGMAQFNVRVQTADWAHVEKLLVVVNGSVVEIIERTAEDGARFDFEEIIDVEFEEDSWILFWAAGPRPSAPIARPKELIAFTNPVFIRTGEGPWEAPGVRPLDLEGIDTGYCD